MALGDLIQYYLCQVHSFTFKFHSCFTGKQCATVSKHQIITIHSSLGTSLDCLNLQRIKQGDYEHCFPSICEVKLGVAGVYGKLCYNWALCYVLCVYVCMYMYVRMCILLINIHITCKNVFLNKDSSFSKILSCFFLVANLTSLIAVS